MRRRAKSFAQTSTKAPCHRWGLIRRRSDVCIAARNAVTPLRAKLRSLRFAEQPPCRFVEDGRYEIPAKALIPAAAAGCRTCVCSMLRTGTSINTRHNGECALHSSIWNGHCTLAQLLVEDHGADVDCVNRQGETPLTLSIRKQCVTCAAMLLWRGADANLLNNKGILPLAMAVESNNREMIRLLLDGGANIDARARMGITALQLAVFNHQCDVVEMFVN